METYILRNPKQKSREKERDLSLIRLCRANKLLNQHFDHSHDLMVVSCNSQLLHNPFHLIKKNSKWRNQFKNYSKPYKQIISKQHEQMEKTKEPYLMGSILPLLIQLILKIPKNRWRKQRMSIDHRKKTKNQRKRKIKKQRSTAAPMKTRAIFSQIREMKRDRSESPNPHSLQRKHWRRSHKEKWKP